VTRAEGHREEACFGAFHLCVSNADVLPRRAGTILSDGVKNILNIFVCF
jgi:hypothetical protein